MTAILDNPWGGADQSKWVAYVIMPETRGVWGHAPPLNLQPPRLFLVASETASGTKYCHIFNGACAL